MEFTPLSNVPVKQDATESVPSQKIMDYFKLILKILAGFILFCWTSTSNYLNSLNIDTDAMYPIFGNKTVIEKKAAAERSPENVLRKKGLSRFENFGLSNPAVSMSEQYVSSVKNNPYATRFSTGPINMKDENSIKEKVGFFWWLELTQQSSYQVGGLILHSVFNFFKGLTQKEEEKGKPKSALLKFFSFLQWLFAFGIGSNACFAFLLVLVFLLWIPGFLGGLIAFMPYAYHTNPVIKQVCFKAFILFWTFVWMCIAGGVTFFPVIYGFFHLLYLVLFKQMEDDLAGFVDEFMKRIGQLMYIYITVAFIIALASKDLPNETKITVAVVFGVSLLYAAYKGYQARTSVESISKIVENTKIV